LPRRSASAVAVVRCCSWTAASRVSAA
jgi:hypothetical protein